MALNSKQRDQITRIFLASLEEEVGVEDQQKLNQLLLNHPEARAFLVELAHLHTSLAWKNIGSSVESLLDGSHSSKQSIAVSGTADSEPNPNPLPVVVDSLESFPNQPNSIPIVSNTWMHYIWPQSISRTSYIALTLCALFAVGVFVFRMRNEQVAQQPSEPLVVAMLESNECLWADGSVAPNAGDPIFSCQKLELVQGVAKLAFEGGATVVVKSPAVIEPITRMSMRVDKGSVAVRSNGIRSDFLVISPEASILDLGTSFGVHAGNNHSTEVEVFEGAVEVQAPNDSIHSQVLGLGGGAVIRRNAKGTSLEIVDSGQDRFSGLIEALWDDIRQDKLANGGEGSVVEAEFNDAPIPKTVDTFYGSTRGKGWRTPWLARGNPKGDVRRDNPLSGDDNPYLALTFGKSITRVVAREYGTRSEFDPRKPHVISWKWRFDGGAEKFGGHYRDRILFFGNPTYCSGTQPNLSWLICVIGSDHEAASSKNDPEVQRKFYPMRWCFYNRDGDGGGRLLDGRDMVDTGMAFEPGVTYSFVVAVYPQEGIYDAAIRNESTNEIVSSTNLAFRNPDAADANVLHFSVRTNQEKSGIGFSLDSVHIEPLEDGELRSRLRP